CPIGISRGHSHICKGVVWTTYRACVGLVSLFMFHQVAPSRFLCHPYPTAR
ncbi:MAG: hypothetical protein QOJ52_1547, partial [Acidimicrobiaceae bacterium]|nr:hypothetical protein [Acidimicrobiaceae bacterium]